MFVFLESYSQVHQEHFGVFLNLGQHGGQYIERMRAHHGGDKCLQIRNPWAIHVCCNEPQSGDAVDQECGTGFDETVLQNKASRMQRASVLQTVGLWQNGNHRGVRRDMKHVLTERLHLTRSMQNRGYEFNDQHAQGQCADSDPIRFGQSATRIEQYQAHDSRIHDTPSVCLFIYPNRFNGFSPSVLQPAVSTTRAPETPGWSTLRSCV